MRFSIVFCFLFSIVAFVPSIEGQKVLVLVDELSQESEYSKYFEALQGAGYELSISEADDPSMALTESEKPLYDSLIILASEVEEFGGSLTVPSILEFVDNGGNLILATNKEMSDPLRELAAENGVEFHPEGTVVADHFNSVGELEALSLDPKDCLVDAPVVVGEASKPVYFKGVGHKITGASKLNFAILSGSSTTYSSKGPVRVDEFHSFGSDVSLISALQARNNARVLIVGSLDFFSDDFATEESSNEQVASQISLWALGSRGALRVRNVQHSRADGVEPEAYTVKDRVVYSVIIEESKDGKWVPFKSNKVQMEFVMLDPYVRGTLHHNDKGKYEMNFLLPDVYGVFTFKLRFREKGYHNIDVSTVKPVRPFRHDEYPRFLRTASPYYASCISLVVGVFLFSTFGLFSK